MKKICVITKMNSGKTAILVRPNSKVVEITAIPEPLQDYDE